MTGIHRCTGIGVATVRTTIEIFALVLGIALGGRAGFGTVAFAVLVGYALAASFRLMTWAVALRRDSAGDFDGHKVET
jgi:uncharacterized membrane protein YczE